MLGVCVESAKYPVNIGHSNCSSGPVLILIVSKSIMHRLLVLQSFPIPTPFADP